MDFKKLLAESILWRGIYFITLFLVNLFLSRMLGAAGIGQVYYISNTFALVQLIAGLCLESGITYFGAGKKIMLNQLLWVCLGWVIIVAAGMLLFFYAMPGNSRFFEFGQMNVRLYAFCFITGLLLNNYGCGLFYAKGNFVVPNFILAVINVGFVVYAINVGNPSLTDGSALIRVYFFMLLLQGVAVITAYCISGKSWKERSLPQWRDTRKLYIYSLQALAANVLFFFVYRVDYYFVHASPVCTAADLGNYVQLSKLGQMLLVVPQIIASAVYPQMSSGENSDGVRRSIRLLARVFALLFLLIMIGVAITGNWLFPFLFGSTFNEMTLPFLLLLPGIYCLSMLAVLSSYFSGKGNVKASIYAAFIALIVVVAGDALLVPKYGIVAAALVSTVGYAANVGYCAWLYWRE